MKCCTGGLLHKDISVQLSRARQLFQLECFDMHDTVVWHHHLACQLFIVTSAKQAIPKLWAADAWENTAFYRGTQNLHYFTAVLAPPTSSLFVLLSLLSMLWWIRCGFIDSGSCFNSHSVTYFLKSQSLSFELLVCGFCKVCLGYRGVLVLGKDVNQLSHTTSVRCVETPTVLDSFTMLGCKILCVCQGCGFFKVIHLFHCLSYNRSEAIPVQVLHRVRYSVSSFSFQYLLVSFKIIQ